MKIRILAVGKIKEKWLKQGISEYAKRVSGYSSVEICEIPDSPESNDPAKDIASEGSRLTAKIRNNDFVVVLDIGGIRSDSVRLAERLSGWMEKGGASVTFLIGGSNGLSEQVIERADDTLSFSELTFPHRLMRLILLEQLFRAFKINNNEKYHK